MLIRSWPDVSGELTCVAADGCAIKYRIAHRPGGLKRSGSGVMMSCVC